MAGPAGEFDGGLIVALCFASISLYAPFCFDHVSKIHEAASFGVSGTGH
jgi:hypothetical protein